MLTICFAWSLSLLDVASVEFGWAGIRYWLDFDTQTDSELIYIFMMNVTPTNHPVGVLLLQQLSLPVGVETTTSPLALTTHSEVLLCNHGTVHPHHSRPVQYSNIALGSAVFALLAGDKQHLAKQSLSVRWVCDQSSLKTQEVKVQFRARDPARLEIGAFAKPCRIKELTQPELNLDLTCRD